MSKHYDQNKIHCSGVEVDEEFLLYHNLVGLLLFRYKTKNLSELLVISSLAQGIGYILAGFGPFICGLLYKGDGQWWPVASFMLCAVLLWGSSAWYAFGNRKLFD